MERLAESIYSLLKESKPFAQAAIIGHRGSTPRTSGSKMLVMEDGRIQGTIGGGLVEAKVMEACTGMLDRSLSRILDFTLDASAKAGMDMICGGSLTVWIRTFVPPFDSALVAVYKDIALLENQGLPGRIVTRITGGVPGNTCLLTDAPPLTLLPGELLSDVEAGRFGGPAPVRQTYGLEDFMIEPILPRDTLFIFGAGHVGAQLARMACDIGFSVVVIDDRKAFADPAKFPMARQVEAIEGFEKSFTRIRADEHSYIVILTRGHLYDQVVLEQALTTRAPYIGMIGSRKKREQIYHNLMEKGVTPARLAEVHSPIGISIKAETPSEIAVSIMGELILERARNRGSARG